MKPAGVWSAVAVASALLIGGAWWVRTRAEAGGPTANTAGADAFEQAESPDAHRIGLGPEQARRDTREHAPSVDAIHGFSLWEREVVVLRGVHAERSRAMLPRRP